MAKRLRIKPLLWPFTLSIALIAVLLTVYAYTIKSRATRLLADIKSLRPGISTGTEALRIVEKHGGDLRSEKCSSDGCEYYFAIENRWLAKVRLEPMARFDAAIYVSNDSVRHLSVWLMRSMPVYPTFQASAGAMDEYAEIPPVYRTEGSHYTFPTPVGKPYLRIMLDSHATADEREHAFAFQFRCLVKPGGGCDLPCDYVPEAWRDWKSSLIEGGFPMDGFDEHYPDNKRCDAAKSR